MSKIKYECPSEVNLPGYKPTYEPHPLQIKKAINLINSSERPVILAGGGIISSDASEELILNVKKIHENGGSTGSRGWRYNWSREIASRPILRSQTTAVSVRFLYKNKTPPIKMFCLSKVFRPDVIDSKHMIEFCQLEGIIGDYGINIRHLLGILTEFANQLGFKEIKFKPSYFPFTEPSIEAYIKHPKLGWIECLGAGLFRPEVTKPLEIDFPVIAWAFGIDRLAMIKLGIDDIRELHTYNLKKLREWGYEIAKD